MGSFFYQEQEGYIQNKMWLLTAGTLSDASGLPLAGASSASTLLEWMGMDSKDVAKLRYDIRIQHSLSNGDYETFDFLEPKDQKLYRETYNLANGTNLSSNQFSEVWDSMLKKYTDSGQVTNADFAHQSITTATILRQDFTVADLYGGKGQVEKLAGWLGDTTSAAGLKPKIGNDDYRADLDAVNITSRMKREGISYADAANSYYAAIDDEMGTTTRANEFKENQDFGLMQSTIVGSLLGHIKPDSLEELKVKHFESYNFIDSVDSGSNNLKENNDKKEGN